MSKADKGLELAPEEDINDMVGIDKDGRFELATPKQRGFVHGLCAKLNIDEFLLPKSLKKMTKEEVSKLIEELKIYRDYGIPPDWYKNEVLYDEDVPFYF